MKLNTEQIGTFIQLCRKELGMSQAELAKKLDISPQSVSNWERGDTHN